MFAHYVEYFDDFPFYSCGDCAHFNIQLRISALYAATTFLGLHF